MPMAASASTVQPIGEVFSTRYPLRRNAPLNTHILAFKKEQKKNFDA